MDHDANATENKMPEKKILDETYKAASLRLREKKLELMGELTGDAAAAGAHLTRHARILDEYFHDSFEQSQVGPTLRIDRNPYAVVALGGYGRQEQCLHSDVDVLLLFNKRVPEAAEGLIREMIYPLWDLGLDIGHATRSLGECAQLAGADPEVLTSLLDARFICGMSPLYSELMERLREKVLFRRAGRMIKWLLDSTRRRHQLFGDSAYLLEPNLKEGQGGLRDYHAMLWIGRIKFGLRQPRDLEYLGLLSHDEYAALGESLNFIWNTRSCLHRLIGRKYDRLHFEYQARIADMLGYRLRNGLEPVERFLADLHGHMERIKDKHLIFLYEMGAPRKWFDIRRRKAPATRFPGLCIERERLCFSGGEAVLRDPALMIRVFEESARIKMPLAPEARRLIREFSHLIDDDFRADREALRAFERILITPAPAFNVLNEMRNTGFLAAYLPAFRGVANRIQHDAYHVYPVDKHLLRTVRILKEFAQAGETPQARLNAALYRETGNRRRLLWAALLHDIGKAEAGEDHAGRGARVAMRTLMALGVREAEAREVAFLVEHHLLLFHAATRRDLNDPETIRSCAAIIVDPERLRMLYLLAVADLMATGPKAWNDWVAALLRDLFFKTLRELEGAPADAEMADHMDKAATLLSEPGDMDTGVLHDLLEQMSPAYLNDFPVEALRRHVALFARLGDGPFAWDIAPDTETDTRTITVCCRDIPGMFSRIAGVLAHNAINVLDARAYIWNNGLCINVFNVAPPPDRLFEEQRWRRAGDDLAAAIEGRLNLAEAVRTRAANGHRPGPVAACRPNKVVIDNEGSATRTIVEVYAADHAGLLFWITDALFRCGLDIRGALIATKVDQVVDVFFVQDLAGRKVVEPDRMAEIRAAVEEALGRVAPVG